MFISVLCDWSSPINTDDTDNDNIYCETNVNEESWWRSKGMQWEPGYMEKTFHSESSASKHPS